MCNHPSTRSDASRDNKRKSGSADSKKIVFPSRFLEVREGSLLPRTFIPFTAVHGASAPLSEGGWTQLFGNGLNDWRTHGSRSGTQSKESSGKSSHLMCEMT